MNFTSDLDLSHVSFCLGHVDYYKPNTPYKISYRNEDWVLWRNNKNEISIISNVCPHRHAPLSDGEICKERNTIVCPYHRFEFDGKGRWITDKTNKKPLYSSDLVLSERHEELIRRQQKTLLPLVIVNNWIWISRTDDSFDIPFQLAYDVDFAKFVLKDHFTFEIDYPLLYLLENLCDVDHFSGSHKKTFFTQSAHIDSLESNKNIISYEFTTKIEQYSLFQKLLHPMRVLFNNYQKQRFTISVPNFACAEAIITKELSVFAFLNWYPKNDHQFVVHAGFFEPKHVPISIHLLRPIITKLRETAVQEDITMVKSLYHENPNYRIRTKNDEPIYVLRNILEKQFSKKADT